MVAGKFLGQLAAPSRLRRLAPPFAPTYSLGYVDFNWDSL
jgi:hypothetical protein